MKWEHLLLHAPANLVIGTLNGEILLASKRLARTLGRSTRSMIGTSLPDLFIAPQRMELAERLRALGELGELTWQAELCRRDGTRFFAHVEGAALRDERNREKVLILHIRDTTRKVEAEKRLVELDALRKVVDNLPVVLFSLDAQGRFVMSEGGGLRTIGLTPGQAVGQSAFELYRTSPWVVNSLKTALAGTYYSGTGEVGDRVFETTYSPTRDQEDGITGVLGLALDVTKRARAEREQQRLIRELHAALELRDEFLSIASHELRTPLSTLSLKIELMRHHARAGGPSLPSARVASDADHMLRVTRRLARLIDELLDVSRITTGRLKLDLEQVDLTEMTEEVTERMRAQFERAENTLIVTTGTPTLARCDRTRLEQVLENLLTNALRHGGGRVEVTLASDRARATLTVRDHGPGIAVDDQKRIFERFVRAAPSGLGGLGLGLYISRQIVEAHRGTIRVDSAPGQGATFVVTLPLAATDSAAEVPR